MLRFFLSSKGCLKIADLGLSRIFLKDDDVKNKHETSERRIRQRQYSHQVATRWYRYAIGNIELLIIVPYQMFEVNCFIKV